MALDYFLFSDNPCALPLISELIERGVQIGAFSDSVGWSHDGLVKLAREFGLSASSHSDVQAHDLFEALKHDFLPIVSIKWAFEEHKTLKEKILFWKKFGGHLVLVVGFKKEGSELVGFFVHHTCTCAEYNWRSRFVPLKTFEPGFTGRCVIVGRGDTCA